MKTTTNQLQSEGYQLIDRLDHLELIPFVKKYLKKKTKVSLFYNLFLSVSVLSLVMFASYLYSTDGISNGKLVDHISYGFAFTLLLIPIHEYIHVLAYKYTGAKTTSFDANWKKFYFLALADRFVANRKEFMIVAWSPFILISLGSIITALVAPSNWTISALSVLIVHTVCCSGDFGLLSYFDFHSNKEIVTYDDKAEKVSYFYEKVN